MSEAHLSLVTKLEELDAYTHTVLHQFPKLERHLTKPQQLEGRAPSAA